jgi:hypothetical protein
MQKIGNVAQTGFTLEDLKNAKKWFEQKGCVCNIISLHEVLPDNEQKQNPANYAWLLVVKNAVNALLNNPNGANALFAEQNGLEKDTKALMYGRVVNKIARHNLCFANSSQEPDYDKGQGRVYAFDSLPNLKRIREQLGIAFGEKATGLQAEGNYYYDIEKCGIGYHGDAERKKVIAFRLGANIPLHFRWYYKNEVVGETMKITNLEHGDMYVMSEKATGFNWITRLKYTLRHSAGAKKYLDEK